MMIKKILLFLALSLYLAQIANAQDVTLGYVDFPPYEYEKDGEPKGALVSIVKTIFQKADIPLTLKLYPFIRAYEMTKQGHLDGLFNFYKTDKRANYFDYSEVIIRNDLVFFVRKDSALHYSSLSDLADLKIGTMRGYTYGSNFDKSGLFTRDPSNSHESNFRKLLSGRIDAYPCDKLVGLYVTKKISLMSEFKTLPTPLKVMKGYIGFTKGNHSDIILRLNTVIHDMHKSGEIENAIKNTFSDIKER